MRKHNGLADVVFLVIIGLMIAVGAMAPVVTKTPDSPAEQLAEKLLYLKTGQEVDFSAHLKKDEAGKVIMTDAKSKTTVPPASTVVVVPSTYGK